MTPLLCALILGVIDPRTPSISPDGGTIVFCYRGDLWTAPAAGGTMRCLTPSASCESHPCHSPDGSLVAFTSDRTGGGDVYVMPSCGGESTRLTWHGGFDAVAGWSASGDSVYFLTDREGRESWVYSAPVSGGTQIPVVRALTRELARMPGGLAVERGETPWWRRHYRGAGSRDIWLAGSDGSWTPLLSTGLDESRPMWSPSENGLLFVREDASGCANLHLLREDGSVAPLTRLDGDITFPSVTADGATVCFEFAGALYRASRPDWTPVEIPLDCAADLPFPLDVQSYAGPFLDGYDILSDTGTAAMAAMGDIFCGNLEDGSIDEVRRLTATPGREGSPAWSPDGRTLAFTVEWDGRSDLVLAGPVSSPSAFTDHGDIPMRILPVAGGVAIGPCWSRGGDMIAYLDSEASLRVVETASGRDWPVSPATEVCFFSWSPDDAWLAYSTPVLGHLEDVFVVPSRGGTPVNVSRHSNDDFQPFWSSDGRRLIYASRTDEGDYSLKQLWLTRADFEADRETREDLLDVPVDRVSIETDDIRRWTETLCTVTGYYDAFGASPDGRTFAFRGYDSDGGSDLWTVDWTGTGLDRLTFSGCAPSDIRVSPEGTVYYIGMGGSLESVPASGGPSSFLGWRERTGWSIPEVQAQKFDECWRLLRDRFYDSALHGTDWDAVREKYRDRAAACILNRDFNDVVSRMLGELSASHLGIYGPWEWNPSLETGELGVIPDYGWDGDGIRIDSIVPWSPAGLEPALLEPGDVILSVDGVAVGPEDDFYRPLAGTVGEEVVLEIRRRGGLVTSTTIEPVSRARMSDLEYEAWIERNRRMVDRLSGGSVGYLHIPGMYSGAVDRFVADLYSEGLDRAEMIVDIRGNGGGHAHDEILRMLSRPGYATTRSRGGTVSLEPLGVWQGPMALLINERCYSDAEIFPAAWRELGLGPIVGAATFGAVIGTVDVFLVDGTGFRIPSSGWFTLEGRNLENEGVMPDIPVAELPSDFDRGIDRQLEAAVEAVMGRI